MNDTENVQTCKNVYKNGKEGLSKEKYTRLWVEIVNRMEKNKNFVQRQ